MENSQWMHKERNEQTSHNEQKKNDKKINELSNYTTNLCNFSTWWFQLPSLLLSNLRLENVFSNIRYAVIGDWAITNLIFFSLIKLSGVAEEESRRQNAG